MGGRPLEAMALIGIGVDNFSITPAAVGPVKAMVRSLDAGAVRARMDKLLAKPPRDMRKALHDWAKRHSVALG
jgi:phosphotransferase system enzyme I (PtsP)